MTTEKQIPAEYAWIKPGVKVRHVLKNDIWEAAESPVLRGDQWQVLIKDFGIYMPCYFLLSADDAMMHDSEAGFPKSEDSMPALYYLSQNDNGIYECGHNGAGVSVFGATAQEALKRMILALENHSVSQTTRAAKDAETLSKARAVLDVYNQAVEYAREKVAIAETAWLPLPATLKALAALADALEGGGDE